MSGQARVHPRGEPFTALMSKRGTGDKARAPMLASAAICLALLAHHGSEFMAAGDRPLVAVVAKMMGLAVPKMCRDPRAEATEERPLKRRRRPKTKATATRTKGVAPKK